MCAAIATSGLACGVDADRAAPCITQTNDDSCAAPIAETMPVAGEAGALAADGCVTATAGGGFVTLPLDAAAALDTVTFTATPSGSGIDAVIGLTAGPATRFEDLAAAVRFAPGGTIDARDGAAYRADFSQTYGSAALDFRVIADVTSKTYSVFQGTFQDAHELARQYAFRSTAPAGPLDHLAVIVDGTAGSVTVCQPRATPSRGVVYSREGRYAVAALPGDQVIISDGATTSKLNAAGRTNTRIARAGEVASDAAGNVVIASVAGGALSVDRYDPTLHAVWHASQAVPAGAVIAALALNGGVAVGVASQANHQVTIARFTAAGSPAGTLALPGDNLALDGDEAVVAWRDNGTLRLTRYDVSGAALWSRAFTGDASITAMTVDPSHAVIFGGELFTPIDFGGGTLPTRRSENGPTNGFVVKLAATGEHVYSMRTEFTLVGGIASNGARTVVSSTERTQFRYPHLTVLDPAGASIATSFATGFGEHGVGGRVAIAASGRIWWNVETLWPLFPSWPYLVAIAPQG